MANHLLQFTVLCQHRKNLRGLQGMSETKQALKRRITKHKATACRYQCDTSHSPWEIAEITEITARLGTTGFRPRYIANTEESR